MSDAGVVMLDHVRGDATGMTIPAHVDAFRAMGADFLTQAFRAFGAISPDNAVTRIVALEPCAGGSTGHKFYLTLDYARAEPGVDRDLFLKFSRDFTDARRDWQRTEMDSEARFVALSRKADFPIRVPVGYFADYETATGTGIIITERIGFGEGAIEPHRRKCLDHETMADPLPYYRASVTALARLAASHKAGTLAPEIEARFPSDPVTGSADPIAYSAAELDSELERCFAFARKAPQLLPETVRAEAFLARMAHDARRIRAHEEKIQRYLRGNADLIALCHWNAHIDNLWFWRDEADGLQCGLIDWGRVGQISFGSALWGGLSAAHPVIWERHLDELLALFVAEYHGHGGPAITVEELEFHLTLHMAAMGVARVLAFPEIIQFRLPESVNATGLRDPMFRTVDPARNCLTVYGNFLTYWHRRDFGAHLDRLLERIG
ncbi:hypothetical protein LWE61_03200 [Sphingobium sufflavum]|uniref:hypothetical protein n=1 Tax=Sphingobium sufflavum TaxID=1129547 RepID=UPI001F3CF1EC|nr:hypothetical protein [Sphingobium sufflavum]MCE7795559.1 hypothetical protein [Sphingobium sufflavum]